MKTVWGINCPIQPIVYLPMDILNDEIVHVIIRINSNPINYGQTLIFVTVLPKVTIKAPLMLSIQSSAFEYTIGYESTPNYGNDYFPNTEEQRLPIIESYSPFHDCDDINYNRVLDDI